MRFGLFTMSEYINLITLSALCVTLFLGGWHGPVAARADLVPAQAVPPALRLHLGADDAAAAALRPADALRLEGAAAGRDAQCGRHGDPGGGDLCGIAREPQPFSTLKGFGVTFRQIFRKPITAAVPGVQARRLSALPRPAHAAPARERAREVRRLLALRGRLPVRLHPRRRRREHRRQPRLGG